MYNRCATSIRPRRLKHKKIEWDHSAPDFTFFGNESNTINMIINLLMNALYFTPSAGKGGEVTLWTRIDDDNNYLYVKDNGCGIPSDVLPKVFEPLFSTRRHGMGLGLTFCKQTMHAINGEIDCESKVDNYTLITLKFPKLDPMPGFILQKDISQKSTIIF